MMRYRSNKKKKLINLLSFFQGKSSNDASGNFSSSLMTMIPSFSLQW